MAISASHNVERMQMYCNHCGKEIPKNSKFCNHCGKAINTTDDSTNSRAIQSDRNDKENHFVIWFFLGIFSLLVVIFIFAGINGPSDEVILRDNEYRIYPYINIVDKSKCKLPPEAKSLGVQEAWLVGVETEDFRLINTLWVRMDGDWEEYPKIDYCLEK
ncbi:MAG: zinc-ribbon domain-containing protein [Candidatus Helarchaeota archaeon]